ncbi:NADP-dependent oxidoreductase [Pyruvatibacter sp. HU-CL02332]|uniref:NADP-dependent oxidoreductase n=1 Tax=Pyruvatibacter sp. HU-CL02332 TaxID=3127650 RepID=UPI0031098543
MTASESRQITLTESPAGKLLASNFGLETVAVPTAGDGELLIRVLYISIDAANRAWMQGRTYRDQVLPGTKMAGGALGEVVVSNDPAFAPGDIVEADMGWCDYVALPASQVQKRKQRGPLTHLLSILGITGKTAYFGMLHIGKPLAGETVVVSAAAGAVGSVAGQLAKTRGARVVGIAGSDKKCKWLTDELGFDAAINYNNEPVMKALKRDAPDGVDVFFDNVGGDIFEGVLFRMNTHGRIVCCGAVSQYDTDTPTHGPRGVPGLIVTKRLKVEGFIVMDFDGQAEAEAELAGFAAQGSIKVAEDIVDGLENAPQALVGLLSGENYGKRLVHVADPQG